MEKVRQLGEAIIGIGVANLLIIGAWILIFGRNAYGLKFSELDWLGQISIMIFGALTILELVLVIIMETMYMKYKKGNNAEKA